MKEYALYKGDELLGIGTLKELAEKNGVKPSTIYFYISPAYKKRGNGINRKVLIKLD